MLVNAALPIYAASAAALVVAVVTYFGRPHIRVRTHNECHNGLRVIEIAFIVSRAVRRRAASTASDSAPQTAGECAIYVTLKSGSR
jgi:hypothetical protein